MTGGVLTFAMPCIPPTTTHQHKRIVRAGRFSRLADKPELNAAKQTLEALLLPHRPVEPVAGPVALRLVFVWPWLKKHTKAQRNACGGVIKVIPHTSRPDASNLAKTLEDRLVALRFLADDNAVVRLEVHKFWGDCPGIGVEMFTIPRFAEVTNGACAVLQRLHGTPKGEP